MALILVDDRGENVISVASGANNALSPAEIDRMQDQIHTAAVLMLQLETPLDTVCRAAEIASAARVPVILDPAPAPSSPLPETLLRQVAYLTPNETEAERLTGIPVVDDASARRAADCLRQVGVPCVIITRGAQGALLSNDDGVTTVPTRSVEAVDATAAGDAFNGGLAWALGAGLPLNDAARWACLNGALSATRLGAQPSLPTLDELRHFAGDSRES